MYRVNNREQTAKKTWCLSTGTYRSLVSETFVFTTIIRWLCEDFCDFTYLPSAQFQQQDVFVHGADAVGPELAFLLPLRLPLQSVRQDCKQYRIR